MLNKRNLQRFSTAYQSGYYASKFLQPAFGTLGRAVLNPIKRSAYQTASARDNYQGKMPAVKRKLTYAQVASKKPRTAINKPGFTRVLRVNQKPAVFQKAPARAKRWTGVGGGTGYTGKFRKPTRRGANINSQYIKYGATSVVETAGTNTDANCVYVGHSVAPGLNLVRTIAMAIIRKMMDQCGVQVTLPTANLPPNCEFLVFSKNASTGALVTLWQYTPASGSMQFNTVSFSLADTLTTFYATLPANNDLYLDKAAVSFIPVPGTSALNYVRGCELNLSQFRLHLKLKSTMKIQNRTATTDSAEADDVDNQPLQGRLYECNTAQPYWRGDSGFGLGNSYATGILVTGAGINNALANPPNPKMIGAAKASNIVVNPGQIKTSALSHTKVGDVHKILSAIGITTTGITKGRQTFGKSKLYALERMINVGLSDIKIVYEAEFEIAAYLSKRGKEAMAQYNF